MNEEEREELENAVSLQISKQLLRIKKITTTKIFSRNIRNKTPEV